MNILIVTQYFWPENFRINELAKDFIAKGYGVTVLTGVPNYPEGSVFKEFKYSPKNFNDYFGVKVIRVPMIARGSSKLMLCLNYFSFFISATFIGLFKLRGLKFDRIFVFAVSPIMVGIPAIVIGKFKKAPVFLWVLDLWPETLEAIGVIKNKFILGMISKMVSWIYNRSDYLLVQSRGFIENVKKYCSKNIEQDRLVYFPSWAESVFTASLIGNTEFFDMDTEKLTIVFAGNIGEAQDFPTILEAIKLLQNRNDLRWVIAGDGRMFNWVKSEVQSHKLKNVLLLGRLPVESMPSLFSKADILFVSLKTNEVFAKTIPGKIQAYLAAAKPILAMIDGEAAKVINEAHAGLTSQSGDAKVLVENVAKMISLPKIELEQLGHNGKNYYEKHFSKEVVYAQLVTLFKNGTTRH